MSFFPRRASLVWTILLACACVFLVWTNYDRLQRVEYVSGLVEKGEQQAVWDARSSTGNTAGTRSLIIPERNEDSFHWISQTQQMLTNGEWRLRRVDYDNAPHGREVRAPSPYRWWLGAVAWVDHQVSGRPIGSSVEHAALYADPVLHGLLLVLVTVFAAWQFGPLAAALLAVGLVSFFPFAAGFLPGVPNHHGLANVFALWSLILVVAGLGAVLLRPDGASDATKRGGRGKLWLILAGVAGGLGLWVSVATQVPLIAALFVGGLLSSCFLRRQETGKPGAEGAEIPWRFWSVSGAITVLVVYLIENFPDNLGSWELERLHPIYGLAWIGAGELLVHFEAWMKSGRRAWSFRSLIGVIVGLATLLALPATMKLRGSRGFLTLDLLSLRLTNQPEGIVSADFWGWLARDGVSAKICAVVLPLVIVIMALWLLFRRTTDREVQRVIAVAIGPALVAVGFAWWRINWWCLVDGAVLVLLPVIATVAWPVRTHYRILLWSALVALAAVPGVIQLVPTQKAGTQLILTAQEAQELVERDLAHWLTKHSTEKEPIVYAPPLETTSLCYYGELKGIGSFAVENKAGFGATLMIAGMQTLGEVQALLEGRGVRYIVIPSWDSFFEDFAQLYLVKNYSKRSSYFISELRNGNLPLWIRPVAYQMPLIPGFEGQSVLVFEVVDEQSPAVVLSREAEYFIEMGDLKKAALLEQALRRFPGDLGALAARAQVQNAIGDAATTAQTIELVLNRLNGGADKFLPWDRRLSLAVVLAQGQRVDQARSQVKRCVDEISDKKIRELSTGSLYNLMVLTRAFGIEVKDPKLCELMLELLPTELRNNL